MNSWYVVEYTLDGKFVATVAGLGRNRNTWDSSHSKRTAQHYARKLRREYPANAFKVESMYT